MVSETHERLLSAYAAFNAGGSPAWDLFHPSIQHDQTEGLFLDGVFFGHDGIRAALAEIEADWDGLTLEPEELIDLGGNRHLVLIRMRARVRDTLAELDAQIAHLWEFDGEGLAIRWAVYGDRSAAMRALSATGPFEATVQLGVRPAAPPR
jgi:hypothetical protein